MNVIRMANERDLPQLAEIFESARQFMHTHGNPNQWQGGYPAESDLRCDIAGGWLYVMVDESDVSTIYGVFALVGEEDPSYSYIENGSWLNDKPYAAIHRIAGNGIHHGIFREAVCFARTMYGHLRIDTHEQNIPMQRAILREGFEYRGVIYLANGEPRYAYEWIAGSTNNS